MRISIALKFDGQRAATGWTGTLSLKATITKNGKVTDRCRLGTHRLAGRPRAGMSRPDARERPFAMRLLAPVATTVALAAVAIVPATASADKTFRGKTNQNRSVSLVDR